MSCEITIHLLELCGMIITAFVVQILLADRPTSEGESVMMRGDNVSALSWVTSVEAGVIGVRGFS